MLHYRFHGLARFWKGRKKEEEKWARKEGTTEYDRRKRDVKKEGKRSNDRKGKKE